MARFLGCGVVAAAFFLAAAMGGAARGDDGGYQIKLSRPEKVGEKFSINTTVDESFARKIEIDDKEVKNEVHDAEFTLEGTLTVTAVDDKGRETGFHLSVKKLEGSLEHAIASPLVEADTEIDGVFKDGKAEFSMKMGGLSEAAKLALSSIFQPPHSDKTDDQLFGTKDKKKAGDTWSINTKAIAADASVLNVSPDKIDGDVTLVGKVDLDGIPALELHTNVEVSEMTLQDYGKSREAKISIKIESHLPVDVDDPSLNVKVTMKRHGIFTPERHGKIEVTTLDSDETRLETRILQK